MLWYSRLFSWLLNQWPRVQIPTLQLHVRPFKRCPHLPLSNCKWVKNCLARLFDLVKKLERREASPRDVVSTIQESTIIMLSLPHKTLREMWWLSGRAVGLSPGWQKAVDPLVAYLQATTYFLRSQVKQTIKPMTKIIRAAIRAGYDTECQESHFDRKKRHSSHVSKMSLRFTNLQLKRLSVF